jgi:hypothetical protein
MDIMNADANIRQMECDILEIRIECAWMIELITELPESVIYLGDWALANCDPDYYVI